MEIRGPARKHGLEDADIQHSWFNAIRLVEYDYNGEKRLLVISARPTRPTPGTGRRAGGYTNPDHPRRPAPPEALRLPEMR